MRRIHILSLDGGGILGIFPLWILHHIEQQTGQPIAHLFQMMGGVSTGGIITLGLTKPSASLTPFYSAGDILKFYKTQSHLIFQQTRWGKFSGAYPLLQSLRNLFFSKYTSQGAEGLFDSLLGESRLSEAVTDIIVPSYRVSCQPYKEPGFKIFSSQKAKLSAGANFLMKDVAMATSAAPTYFPPRAIKKSSPSATKYCFIDGGVAMNDPSLLLYTEARRKYPQAEIFLLSLGIGQHPYVYQSLVPYTEPGILAWFHQVGRLIVGPQVSAYAKILKQAMSYDPAGAIYQRIQPKENHLFSGFDDYSPQHLAFLDRKAYEAISSSRALLSALIRSLKAQ